MFNPKFNNIYQKGVTLSLNISNKVRLTTDSKISLSQFKNED